MAMTLQLLHLAFMLRQAEYLGRARMAPAVVRALASHQCGLGSNLGVDAYVGRVLLLVLSLAPRGFSPGTPFSPLLIIF